MNAKEFNGCLKLIKDGNCRGIEQIYNNYYEKLLLTVNLEIDNRYVAEDIVSNVFTSIFCNAANYKYIRRPNAWMYKIAKFAIINYKKVNKKYVFTEAIDEKFMLKDRNINFKIVVKQTLEQLPKRQQDVVLLHFIYGLKIWETAKSLKISVSTVNREIIGLRKKLKFLLNY